MSGTNETATKTSLGLSGVPETMLWPLWNRAVEAARDDRLIEDPMAAQLVESIDYDFAGSFKKPTVFHPIRARVGDDLIRDYLVRAGLDAAVVALGEGLDTQRWRVAADGVPWITVDVPEAIEVRQRLLPADEAVRTIACSALDRAWMDAVPADATPFVSAAGLLMYFEEAEVRSLLGDIAARFPGADVFFDTITPAISAKTLRGLTVAPSYTAPPMPWGIVVDDLAEFVESVPALSPVTVQSYADPFPRRTRLYRLLSRIPALRRRYAGGLVHARAVARA